MKKSLVLVAAFLIMLVQSCTAKAQWGVEIGGGGTNQHGHYLAPCGCTFAFGSGYEAIVAVTRDFLSVRNFTIGLRVGGEFNQFLSGETDTSGSELILHGHQEEVKLLYLSLAPYLRYNIMGSPVFVQAAPGAAYVVSSHFLHIGALDSSISPNAPLDIRSMRYDAKFSAGYNIALSGLTLAPMITYDLPLNDLRTSHAENWRLSSVYGSIVLRLNR
ncbi:MAG: hypothetical protein ACHQNE_08560 [Candidatus Kapaibacterium sp.]